MTNAKNMDNNHKKRVSVGLKEFEIYSWLSTSTALLNARGRLPPIIPDPV